MKFGINILQVFFSFLPHRVAASEILNFDSVHFWALLCAVMSINVPACPSVLHGLAASRATCWNHCFGENPAFGIFE
jgi:hypothetical protein